MNLRKTIKKSLFALGYYRIFPLKNTCYIINYHKISKSRPNLFYPEMSLNIFEKQVRHLSKNYTIVPIDELIQKINSKKSFNKCVAITFDDGFRDNYLNAYPVLKKYNAPATIYLISDCVESGVTPWFIKFRYAFANTPKKNVSLFLGDTKLNITLDDSKNRLISSNKVMDVLRTCCNQDRINFLKKIYQELNIHEKNHNLDNMMLTWTQIKEMRGNGIDFGAHTHTHPILSKLPLKEAEQEIRLSKEIIEANIGSTVTGFAYPVGMESCYKASLFEILKTNQFKYAVTTSKNRISYKSNLYELSRPQPWELTEL